jgi:TIR domain
LKLLFFSYAHEDQVEVEKIAESLQQDGFLIWLDKKNLLPGDDWRVAIETAMDKADFILVFLSKSSVLKVGYVQKELRYALERSQLSPSGKRYIIPILLEPCTPPHELQYLHWLPLWEHGAYEKLKNALNDFDSLDISQSADLQALRQSGNPSSAATPSAAEDFRQRANNFLAMFNEGLLAQLNRVIATSKPCPSCGQYLPIGTIYCPCRWHSEKK